MKFRVEEINKLHEEVHLKIERQNTRYVEQVNRRRKLDEFEVDDLVSVHLRQ